MIEVIFDYWAVLGGFVTLVVWLVRMEAKGMSNEKEIKRLWVVRKEDRDSSEKANADLKHDLETIGRDMKDGFATLNADIKRLLARGADQ